MSKVETVQNDGRILANNYDTKKTFIGCNSYIDAIMNNATYGEVTIPGGTLMGRVAATQKIVPLKSGATDGSQIPVGILNQNHVIEASEDKEVSICVKGDVNEGCVILDGTDTLDTIIDGRSIRDRIAADTVGVRLVEVDELTDFDNS